MGMWSSVYGAGAGGGSETDATQDESIAGLQSRIDTLVLINMAMWSLLRDKLELTEEELKEKVHEIDMLDGVADGKVTKHVLRCGECERIMSPRHKRCVYCGAERLDKTAFDKV
jgi:hypothetical protein